MRERWALGSRLRVLARMCFTFCTKNNHNRRKACALSAEDNARLAVRLAVPIFMLAIFEEEQFLSRGTMLRGLGSNGLPSPRNHARYPRTLG